MADNAPSKIQYDDFIANVQPDPAKPESTIMLSGFVGHGGDGVVRIYPDPSLGTWYDVPEADVVHSMAVPDSKLGGSYVWVRASSQIKPGSAAAAAPAAAAAAPAAQAAPNFTIGAGCTFICAQPDAALQPTPATHCFVCPSITQQCMQPTPTADVTLATICTQHNHCLQPTPTVHQSLATVCSQICPTFQVGCLTLPNNCFPITQPAVCTLAVSPNCPPPAPGTPVQQQAFAAAAVQPTPTVQTRCFVCPPITLQPQCGLHTAPPACPHQTIATVCTELCHTLPAAGCWTTQPVICFPQTIPQICTIAVSPNCPGPAPGTPVQQPGIAAAMAMQPTPSAVNQCGVHTAATVCTQPAACQPSIAQVCPTPSAVHQCGPNTAATVCTQPPACHPSVNMICPTPSAVHQCGQPQGMLPMTWQQFGCQPTAAVCPAPAPAGVFTPFCR